MDRSSLPIPCFFLNADRQTVPPPCAATAASHRPPEPCGLRERRGLTTLALAILPFLSTSCASLKPGSDNDQAVVYALGERGALPSPLTTELHPACPALRFRPGAHTTSDSHRRSLEWLAAEWEGSKEKRFLIAGYTPPGLPPDYARTLSERRAHAIRQSLIEMGVEPAGLQTVGYGNDFPHSGPTGDVVVIYQVD